MRWNWGTGNLSLGGWWQEGSARKSLSDSVVFEASWKVEK